MGDVSKITKNQNFTTDPKTGQNRLAKGNKIGRMRKKGYTLADLTKTAMEYDKTHDITILKHYISMLMSDNRLLDKFIDRYVPTKTINELTGKDGSPLTFERVVYVEDKGDKQV